MARFFSYSFPKLYGGDETTKSTDSLGIFANRSKQSPK